MISFLVKIDRGTHLGVITLPSVPLLVTVPQCTRPESSDGRNRDGQAILDSKLNL